MALAGFGTRNTLSTQTDPRRGIGAARDWLYSQFKLIADDSGGRLSVSLQTFTQPVAVRIPKPTVLTNVVATLIPTAGGGKSDRAENDDRILVVSGHFDSMPTSPTAIASQAA